MSQPLRIGSDHWAAGDQMQSSLSRIIAFVTTQELPYEVRMAVHEGASAVEAWTSARRSDAARSGQEQTHG